MGANGGGSLLETGSGKGGAGSGRVLLEPNAGEHPEFLLLMSLLYGSVFSLHIPQSPFTTTASSAPSVASVQAASK